MALSEQLKQDIEDICKQQGVTTPVEDILRTVAGLALFGWVMFKFKKAGKQKESE